ncbi:MAG: 4-hydroxythreonine-4-phosphate dehydrogenase PdxA [Calditerrivibrio sp.]|nr:4-hydroxythreonine-4-phosphate dehydrogenase PdxA [Calditerrivibrio sp.]
MRKNKILITMGDPSGVGPEIIWKLFKNHDLSNYNIKVVGYRQAFKDFSCLDFEIVEPDYIIKDDFIIGRVNPLSGLAAMKSIEFAVGLILSGEADALVTAPINKKSIQLAGYLFPGHTEYLAYLTGAKEYSMMLVGDRIKTVLVTTHLPLKDVPLKIDIDGVYRAIKNAHLSGKFFGNEKPHIAVCGLNPHAGDDGALGDEELDVIKPAIQKALDACIDVSGPYPADSLFAKMLKGFCDIAVVMYHDQGLIPVKMESFGSAVNVTLNLPIIRTSVDHGTAFDIAGKNLASESSLLRAIRVADFMVKNVKSIRNI